MNQLTTKKGLELYCALKRRFTFKEPYSELDFQYACSALCKSAPRYARMQERSCSDDPGSDATAALWERQEATLQNTIRARVCSFPRLSNGHVLEPIFQNDPRGHTIKLKSQGAEEIGDEIGVPGS